MNVKTPNPKLIGSNLIDCKPQTGLCPGNCNQCFYNRPGASYIDPKNTRIPTKRESEGKIVRMNSLHDSNIQRWRVLKAAKKYQHVFYNTAIPEFDFPGPVVYTANSSEEQPVEMDFLRSPFYNNLMFVRFRVSSTNLHHIDRAVGIMHEYSDIPIVLTFMAYYDYEPNQHSERSPAVCYVWETRHINKYWCPTRGFKRYVLNRMRKIADRQVTMCGTLYSNYCKDCHNCESYYYITKRRLDDINDCKIKSEKK